MYASESDVCVSRLWPDTHANCLYKMTLVSGRESGENSPMNSLWCPSLSGRRLTAEKEPRVTDPSVPLALLTVQQTALRYIKPIS